jgi:tryptophan synthase alpha chain
VVGSALVDTIAASLDGEGRARPDTAERVLAQVRALSEAIRGARRGREERPLAQAAAS